MKTDFHVEITRRALTNHFSNKALAAIIKANIKQDRLEFQLNHDHIHFDGSAFKISFQYIIEQETMVLDQLRSAENTKAWKAFGRIIHSWQDFYSHSNYVKLWRFIHQQVPPEEIDMDDPDIFNHPNLASGKNYGLIELFALLPPFSRLVKPRMPEDSHAKMNLDSPSSGRNFEYAYWAALKRTTAAYRKIIREIERIDSTHKLLILFKDKQ